jgi:hypothetical protein
MTVLWLSWNDNSHQNEISRFSIILFQKFSFSTPTDQFFLVKFNIDNGKGEKICDFNIKKISIEAKKKLLYGVAEKDALLLNLSNYNSEYKMFYTIGKYFTYILSSSGHIIKKIWGRANSYIKGDTLFYTELSNLIAFDLLTEKKTHLLNNIRFLSVASTSYNTFLFKKGKIINFEKKSNVGKYYGLVTESGYLSGNWIWFSQRKHEKTSRGEIWVQNILTGETQVARKWWKNKWGHSVALMELEPRLDTLLCNS